MSEIEAPFLARLKAGDDAAFAGLVADLGPGLFDFARTFTSSPALAEDIVQETWLAVIRGLGGFEGRASLKTWIFSILVRRARTMTARDARLRARTAARAAEVEWEPGQGRRGLWEETPVPWSVENPEAIHQSHEALVVLQSALTDSRRCSGRWSCCGTSRACQQGMFVTFSPSVRRMSGSSSIADERSFARRSTGT